MSHNGGKHKRQWSNALTTIVGRTDDHCGKQQTIEIFNLIKLYKIMSKIKYDFYKNPDNRTEALKSQYHIRICDRQSIGTNDIINNISKRSTLTPIDIRAVITAFQDEIAYQLGQGRIIRLEGLCSFDISLKTANGICTGKENASNIILKSVNINPEKDFTEKVKECLCEMEKIKGEHSDTITDEKVDEILTEYFKKEKSITRPILQRLCSITKYMAGLHIKRLMSNGSLCNIGFRNHPLYVPSPGSLGTPKE